MGDLNALEMRRRFMLQPNYQRVVWNNLVNGYLDSSGWVDRNSIQTNTKFANGIATTEFYTISGGRYTMRCRNTPQVFAHHRYLYRYYCSVNQDVTVIGAELAGGKESTESRKTGINEWGLYSGIVESDIDGNGIIYIPFMYGMRTGAVSKVKNVLYIDLTLMFGEGHEPKTVVAFEKICAKNGEDLDVAHSLDAGTVKKWIL